MKAEVKVVDLTGKEIKSLPFEVSQEDRGTLFTQYLRISSFGQRAGQAKTKSRGEVSGGGKKPWKQKGTGRARQGSTRSPIWKGGGVAHGPTPHEYTLKFNKKYMPKVWDYVLSKVAQSANGWVVLETDEKNIKTKQASQFLKKLDGLGKGVLFVSSNEVTRRAFKNIDGLTLSKVENLNPRDVSLARLLITTEDDFDSLKKKAKA